MSFSQLLDTIKNGAKELKNEAMRFKNKDVMHAAVAISALTSAADGDIDATEKKKMKQFMENYEPLKVYSVVDVVKKFKDYCELLELDEDLFEATCMDSIAKLKKDPNALRFVIRMGIAIGGSDGDFDKDEQAVIRKVCVSVGIDPTEFEL